MNIETNLTPREEEITRLVVYGASKKEVANRLYISVRTVETTIRNVYEKLAISKVAELCVWWFESKHNISKTHNPLIAMCMLFLVVCSEGNKIFRAIRRPNNETVAYRSKRRNDTEI